MSDKQNETIKKEEYKILDFNEEMLNCMNVNLNAIETFKLCKPLASLEGYEKLKDDKILKNMIEGDEDKYKTLNDNCLDLLGVYISPQNDDKGNIFLSSEKIKETAKKYNIEFDAMYNFVKIHEYAHASMCPKLKKMNNCTYIKGTASYVLIEESLATAIALKKMKHIADYSKLENFVMNQPTQYRYGLELLNKYEKDIENIMIIWKLSKCLDQNKFKDEVKDFNSCDEVLELFYTLTNNELFLSDEAKDIFIF